MSDYERRFEAAKHELEMARIWHSNAVPPYIWFLRKLGLSPIPPHYKPLWRIFLEHTIFFTLLIGLTSFSTVGGLDGRSIAEFGARTVLIGLALGLTMVIYLAVSRRKYALSLWEDL
jgi:hypothetical protein